MRLAESLERDYGISATSVRPHEGGWEADCFLVDNRFFVKAWRRGAPTNLAVLEQLAARGLPVIPPLRTKDGHFSTAAYAVFPYVNGSRAPDNDPGLIGRALRAVHAISDVELTTGQLDGWCIEPLRSRLNHEWVADRRSELAAAVDRLEAVIEVARATDVPDALVHTDLYGDNLLVDDTGRLLAILDWDHAYLGPREHDLWMLADEHRAAGLLEAYGAFDLDPTHLEYAMLARALGDLTVRLCEEVDRPGINEWGFRRLERIDEALSLAQRTQ
jgi:Ser/Thr protein kinase RdoA (MazF antagonist)